MMNKNFSRSNADTEDEESERSLPDHPLLIDVWAHNFPAQLQAIAQLAPHYPLVSLDTEFPGNFIPRHSLAHRYPPEDLDYQLVWHNVEQTRLIQVGITLADPSGRLPSPATWQFHLCFELGRENVVPESISLLEEAGIPFRHLGSHGIQPQRFAEGLISSGLILNKSLSWVVFHGCYDFAYLLRLLRDEPLPQKAEDFYKSIHIYFPTLFDLKQVLRDHPGLREAGLNSIAHTCQRIGPKHQAGSDSLLTIAVYFQLRHLLGSQLFATHANSIYGIPKPPPKANLAQHLPLTHFPQNTEQGPLYQYLQHNQLEWPSSGFRRE